MAIAREENSCRCGELREQYEERKGNRLHFPNAIPFVGLPVLDLFANDFAGR